MAVIFKNAKIFTQDGFKTHDVILNDNKLFLDEQNFSSDIDREIDLTNLYLLPGFVDVHVHFREPGFEYKETILTGSKAAAHGGYTAVCTMPNLKPVPSNLENLKRELEIINRDAVIKIFPIGAITKNQSGRGELSNIEELAPYVIAFSDDGKGVQNENLMLDAMKRIKAINGMITAHCEVESELKQGGCIHEGEYAKKFNHVGINSASEFLEVERDIKLAEQTGCKFHVCHVSTKESVNLIRKAKNRGVNITAETAPHYLIFNDMDLQEDGKFKMNPPIRSEDDKQALIQGIQDGTIDCIITDHAPHSLEEKSRGLEKSAFGIVGLETCFAVMYTNLVLKNIISLEKLLELMCVNPRKIFNLKNSGSGYIENNCVADFVIMDLDKIFTIDPKNFYSKGKSTPFENMKVQGQVLATYVNGNKIYDAKEGIICAN